MEESKEQTHIFEVIPKIEKAKKEVDTSIFYDGKRTPKTFPD